jgi:hypothetical protein
MPKDPRQYARIAVDLPVSRKLAGTSPALKWLNVVAIIWSVQNLTDGEVTPAIITATAGVPARLGKDLLDRDLWHNKGHHCDHCPQPETAGNVVIHDFLLHQDSAETIRRNRDEKAKAGRLANHLRWKHAGPIEECPKCNE